MIRDGRGGGENITFQKITLPGTLAEILIFCGVYGLASVAQLVVLALTAVILGQVAGVAFLALAAGLSFSFRGLLKSNPLQVGIYAQAKRSSDFVRLLQALTFLFGAGVLLLQATGYMPSIYTWHLAWSRDHYIVWARWAKGEWYQASSLEVAARLLLSLAVPFVCWPALAMLKWAARMEATRPTFRETPHGEISSETLEGPFGEEYRAAHTGAPQIVKQADPVGPGYDSEPMQVD